MSSSIINVSISGEIIESRNYLSNYFLTLTTDQTITGNKSILSSTLNISSYNVSLNTSTLNVSSKYLTLNSNELDISASVLKINGNSGIAGQVLSTNGNFPIWRQNTQFGASDIDAHVTHGIIYFPTVFDSMPVVTITQYSNRIVPITVTSINTSSFTWAGVSTNIGKIMWTAGY